MNLDYFSSHIPDLGASIGADKAWIGRSGRKSWTRRAAIPAREPRARMALIDARTIGGVIGAIAVMACRVLPFVLAGPGTGNAWIGNRTLGT